MTLKYLSGSSVAGASCSPYRLKVIETIKFSVKEMLDSLAHFFITNKIKAYNKQF